MIAKFFFIALCGAAIAQDRIYESFSELDTLKNMMDEGSKIVLETLANIEKAPVELKNFTAERLECLLWGQKLQEEAINKTITEATFKGMLKNKWFSNFQCIAKASEEAFQKVGVYRPKIPIDSNSVIEKGLAKITPFRLIMPGLYDYVQDYHNIKRDELIKANNKDGKNKILKEAENKIKHLKWILQQTNDLVRDVKFKTFEEHINFAFEMENKIKKTQKEEAQKILKCIA